MLAAVVAMAAPLAASQPDLAVIVRYPEESSGTMHYAESLRLEIENAEPLLYERAPVPLPGPHFRLPGGRFLLAAWSSPGAGMQSMHVLIISVRNHAVTLDRELIVSTDRSSSGLLLRLQNDRSLRVGLPEPQFWGADEAMWYLDLGGTSKPLDFDGMHRLAFEDVEHQEGDVFYDGSTRPKHPPSRVAWIEITAEGLRLVKPLRAPGSPRQTPRR